MQLISGIPDDADLNFDLFVDNGDGKISAFTGDELSFIGLDFGISEVSEEICSATIKLYTDKCNE